MSDAGRITHRIAGNRAGDRTPVIAPQQQKARLLSQSGLRYWLRG